MDPALEVHLEIPLKGPFDLLLRLPCRSPAQPLSLVSCPSQKGLVLIAFIFPSKYKKKMVYIRCVPNICVMIFVPLSSDLVSSFLWLVWVWAAKLCHVRGVAGRGLCDKHTLRYISWHYSHNHDQSPAPAFSLIRRDGRRKNCELKPTKCISLLLFSILWIWKLHLKIY